MKHQMIAPCLFGMESTVSYELKNMGIKVIKVSDGRVTFEADEYEIARANISLRTAERVLLKVGEFKATSFEALYNGMAQLPFERYIGPEDSFPIAKAKSLNSKLFSKPDIQSIAKKAVVDRLKKTLKVNVFPEKGVEYPINLFLFKDMVEVTIDTTGKALHKRGYREFSGVAPLRETIAAFMVMATPWTPERFLMDPMCGSGTILIEAAMIGANMMPGINREFIGENFSFLPKRAWQSERKDALQNENNIEFKLLGMDIDPEVINLAKENAELAGVGHLIDFQEGNFRDFSTSKTHGFLITNPPYGERMNSAEEVEELHSMMKTVIQTLKDWSVYIITTSENLEKELNVPFQKKRNIYNGMLKSFFYQYLGPRPKNIGISEGENHEKQN